VSRIAPPVPTFPLFLDDVVTDPAPRPGKPWRSVQRGDRLVINWVCTPPSPGSGGHTTMFRLIEYLEAVGHTCRVYLYDRFQNDHRRGAEVIRRSWPRVRATVGDARQGMAPADAVFATSWGSAHVVALSSAPGRRFYLVQDFEPDFYGASAEKLFAEVTYRFGFYGITAGAWLAQLLRRDYGMSSSHFEFGCDTSVYRLWNNSRRFDVVFYSKADVPRRGFMLGVLALKVLAEKRPGVAIHLYGNPAPALPFKPVHHGYLLPDELNDLYNKCAVGLSLSLTNVSLVPWEMMASGCIPVVNDAEHNREVLDSKHVVYAQPTPAALASALARQLDDADLFRRAEVAARAVTSASWEAAGAQVETALVAVLADE
jgi:hypothetical protein